MVAKNTWSNLMHEARVRVRISKRNPGKAWEISGKYGKSRLTPKYPGKSRDIFLVNPIVDSKIVILIETGKLPETQFCHAFRCDLKVNDVTLPIP